MAATIRIVNWNIQNFGKTKCGLNYRNFDVNRAIARVVLDMDTDIFVMLELNTTGAVTARRVAKKMRRALIRLSSKAGRPLDFQTCVLSPNTGLEFYAFFIRDTAVTTPLPLDGPLGSSGVPVDRLSRLPGLTAATFSASTAAGVIPEHFPLLGPDRMLFSKYSHRPLGYAPWPGPPGARLPVLGLFYVANATPSNRVLPIIACHFAPNHDLAKKQIATLPYFSIFADLVGTGAHIPAGTTLQVRPPGSPAHVNHATNHYVLLGDFNVDYNTDHAGYQPLEKPDPALGTTGGVTDNTHLVTPGDYRPTLHPSTRDLAVHAYDNFFSRVSPTWPLPVNVGTALLYDVPKEVRRRHLKLVASVDHYDELDQKGFTPGGEYRNIMFNFADQLTVPGNLITVEGALVGARLISDHLPVSLTVTLD